MNTLELQPQPPEVYEAYAEELTIPKYIGESTRGTRYSREKTPLQDDDIVVAYERLPIGNFGGSLKELSAPELGAILVRDVLKSTNVNYIGDKVDTVVFGNVIQAASGMNPAGTVKANSGIRESATATTVNAACASGFESLFITASEIKNKDMPDIEVGIVGGMESMSQLPHLVRGKRDGTRLGNIQLDSLTDGIAEDSILDGLTCAITHRIMGTTAEAIAKKFKISRRSADLVAVRSQHLAEMVQDQGLNKSVLVPVDEMHDGKLVTLGYDEYVKGTTVSTESLATLRPAFVKKGEEGVVTVGNSSGINDCAAGGIVTTVRRARKLGLEPKMRLLASSKVGVDPAFMGLGPIPAVTRALRQANLNIDDLAYVGINEAFSVVPLVCAVALKVPRERLNPYSSAISIGHPLGATGAIMMAELQAFFDNNPDSRWGVVSTCVGGGQGYAAVFEQL